jgi:hypothetical protein
MQRSENNCTFRSDLKLLANENPEKILADVFACEYNAFMGFFRRLCKGLDFALVLWRTLERIQNSFMPGCKKNCAFL